MRGSSAGARHFRVRDGHLNGDFDLHGKAARTWTLARNRSAHAGPGESARHFCRRGGGEGELVEECGKRARESIPASA
eukprot:6191338-Pleurochrysis_carterae.AAC.4